MKGRIIDIYQQACYSAQVQDEIDSIVGRDRDVVWDDRHALPYTRAAIAEIQRFADIAPTAVAHKALCDVDFHGFHIPKVWTSTLSYFFKSTPFLYSCS